MADAKRDKRFPNCARCPYPRKDRACTSPKGKGPADCPTLRHRGLSREIFETLSPEEMRFSCMAAAQEYACYPDRDKPATKPRIVEIVEFAKRMRYARLGLVFCGGAMKEAGIVQTILETNGFTVVSVMCKAGGIPRDAYFPPEGDTHPTGPACNPKFQAQLANMAEVDFNIVLNLCVGHDSLALKNLEAPATVLAVKDRVTGHNPLAPIYLYDSYYRFLQHPLPDPE